MLRHWSQLVPNNYVNWHPRTLSNTTATATSSVNNRTVISRALKPSCHPSSVKNRTAISRALKPSCHPSSVNNRTVISRSFKPSCHPSSVKNRTIISLVLKSTCLLSSVKNSTVIALTFKKKKKKKVIKFKSSHLRSVKTHRVISLALKSTHSFNHRSFSFDSVTQRTHSDIIMTTDTQTEATVSKTTRYLHGSVCWSGSVLGSVCWSGSVSGSVFGSVSGSVCRSGSVCGPVPGSGSTLWVGVRPAQPIEMQLGVKVSWDTGVTITITIYFINPSGKLKLAFDRTTKNTSQ